MAVKVSEMYDASRKDFLMIDPTHLVIRPELGGRRYKRSDEDVASLAVSMMTQGQLQPVTARKANDGLLMLVFGFTRAEAALLIRKGFDWTDPATDEVTRKHDPNFKLKVILTDGNEKTSFIANVVENAHRNATSPIDDAFNQHKLRDQYGYNDTDISKLYRWKDPAKVGRYRKLLSLNDEVQWLVHVGDMSVQAALDLLELPEEQRAEAIHRASNENGKVNGAVIRSTVRENGLESHEQLPIDSPAPDAPDPDQPNHETNGEATPPKPTKKYKPLSPKEIRTFWEDILENNVGTSERLHDLCKLQLLWLAGKRSNKTMKDNLVRIVEG